MARTNCFVQIPLLFPLLLGKVGGIFYQLRNPNYDWNIDFKTLLDSYLGTSPAIWLASQSIVYEMKIKFAWDYGLRPVHHNKDGVAAGFYLASLLAPRYSVDHPYGQNTTRNSGLTGDICRSLVELLKAKEKQMIGLDTLRKRVVKSIVGHGFLVETTRNLCKNLVSGIEATWEDNDCPWYDAGLQIALDGAFQKVLSAHLTDQGIEKTRALRFASELETTLRIVDSTLVLEDAFEYFMRDLVGNIMTMILRGSAKQSAVPSLKEFTKLSDNAARQLPQGPIPVGTSQLSKSDDPVCIIGTFTEIAMGSLRVAAALGGRFEVSADSAISVMDHLHDATLACRSGFLERRTLGNVDLGDAWTTELKSAARAVRKFVDTLPPVKLSRFYNWPDIGGYNLQKAHARTAGEKPVYEPAIPNSGSLSPSSTATTFVHRKRQNLANNLDPLQTPVTQKSLSHDPESYLVAGYIITFPHKTGYHRVPDYNYNCRYTATAACPTETSKGSGDAVPSSVPTLATVTSTRTIIRNFPRYTTTATTSYTTTSTVTSTYTDYLYLHGTVKQCHDQYTSLCWYNLLA